MTASETQWTQRGNRSMRRLGRRAAFSLATSDRVERAVLASPMLQKAAFRQAKRYIAGLDEQAALATVRTLSSDGLAASVDLFGENVDDTPHAELATDRYMALAAHLAAHAGTDLALDCSHLGLDRDPAACHERVQRIAQTLPAGTRLQLGAEQSSRTSAILEIAYAIAAANLPVMVTVQANLRRTTTDVDELTEARIPIRLTKGAYVESQHVAYPWGPQTDAAYVGVAERLVSLSADHSLATHDPAILTRLLRNRKAVAIEFLLGVRSKDACRLAACGHRVRIYVPFGQRWFRYYARRAAESIGA